MNMLPEGKRVDDPPRKSRMDALRFRLKLLAAKYPIQIAFVIALFALLVPVYMLIESNVQLRSDAKTIRESNKKVSSSLVYIQESRRIITEKFCSVINNNSASTNAQNVYLQKLIVDGVKQSKAFDDFLKTVPGIPPYRERLKRARTQAANLEAFRVEPLNCGDLFQQINCQVEALRAKTDAAVECGDKPRKG